MVSTFFFRWIDRVIAVGSRANHSCSASVKMDKKLKKRPFKVSIEGNVGCGKSTLIDYFKQFPEVDACPEPVAEWRNFHGHNLLHLLYSDPDKWNFPFQHNVQLSRLKLQTKDTDKAVQIFERSLQNNRHCFVEMAHDEGVLTDPEYTAMCEWYSWIENNMDIGLDLIVYLRSSPEIVYERMCRRARPEEKPVSLEYLTVLHEAYEKWLMQTDPASLPAPVLVLDVNQDLPYVSKLYQMYENYILGKQTVPKHCDNVFSNVGTQSVTV
ncbi:deoxynucleoside kinase isoform X2 [Bemisia tabaci]|uniref:deoxynucleoside kinase isoform X2 n=1 Tax=Bemisia tabaci TaxID=7038 RepID=UPI003B27DBCE